MSAGVRPRPLTNVPRATLAPRPPRAAAQDRGGPAVDVRDD